MDVHIIDDADGGFDRRIYKQLKEKLMADETANLVSRKPTENCVLIFTNHHGFLDTLRKRANSSNVYCIGSKPVFDHESLAECVNTVSSLLHVDDKQEEITTTNIRDFELDQLRSAVKMIGGLYNEKLRPKEVTILIEQTPIKRPSQKHAAAVNLKIPIVTPDWIFSSLYEGRRLNMENWPLPIFEDKTICCTGFQTKYREKMARQVKKFGGTFVQKLSSEVDFLVAKDESGSKYEFAQENRIKVCTYSWFRACVKQIRLLRPMDYPFNSSDLEEDEPENLDEIKFPDKEVEGRDDSMFEIEETVDFDWQQCKGPVIDDPDNDFFLEDCMICLIHLEPQRLHDRAVKLILTGGGTRLSYFHPDAMYIVTTNPKKAKDACRERIPGSKIVNMGWLEACYKSKSCVPTKEFELEASKKRRSSFWSTKNDSADEAVDFTNFYQNIPKDKRPDGIFVNLTFQIRNLPFTEKEHCSKMIKENGGTIVEAQTPHYVVATDLGGREGDICKCHAVSPRWIDACIVEGKLAPLGVNLDHFPKYHVSSKTCPDFADFTIVLGGFKPKQRNAIEKLVNTIGGTYEKTITPTENLILICPFLEKELRSSKYSDAGKLEVPVVTLMWLMDSIMRGSARKPGKYHFNENSFEPENKEEDTSELGLEFSKSLNAQLRSLHFEEINFSINAPQVPASSKAAPILIDQSPSKSPEKPSPVNPMDFRISLTPEDKVKIGPFHKPPSQEKPAENSREEVVREPTPDPLSNHSLEEDQVVTELLSDASETVPSQDLLDKDPSMEDAEMEVSGEDPLPSQNEVVEPEPRKRPEKVENDDMRKEEIIEDIISQLDEDSNKSKSRILSMGSSGKKKSIDKPVVRRESGILAAAKRSKMPPSLKKKSNRIKPSDTVDMKKMSHYHFWVPGKVHKKYYRLKKLIEEAGGTLTKSMNLKVTHYVFLTIGDLGKETKIMDKAKAQHKKGKLKFIFAKKLKQILMNDSQKDENEKPFGSISTNAKAGSLMKKSTGRPNSIFMTSQDIRPKASYSKKRKSSDLEGGKQDSAKKKVKRSDKRKLNDGKEPARKRPKREEAPTYSIAWSTVSNRQSVATMVSELGWKAVDQWGELSHKVFSPHEKRSQPIVTHLVMGKLTQTVKIYVALAVRAKIVKQSWLDQCFQEKKYIPEDDYLWENETDLEELQELMDYIPHFRKIPLSKRRFWKAKVFMHNKISGPMLQCQRILSALGAYVTVGGTIDQEYDYYLFESPDEDNEDLHNQQVAAIEKLFEHVESRDRLLEVEICMDYFASSEEEAFEKNSICNTLYDQSEPMTEE